MKFIKAIEEIEDLLEKRRWILERLRLFEKKYNISTKEFVNAWKRGSLPEPDDPDIHGDFMVWKGLYDELIKIEEELRRRI